MRKPVRNKPFRPPHCRAGATLSEAKAVPIRDSAVFLGLYFRVWLRAPKGIDPASQIHTFERVAGRILGKSRYDVVVAPESNLTPSAKPAGRWKPPQPWERGMRE
jgi:hypothetical protein